MFYEPDKNNHGLPYNPFKAIVSPRPIGWISTIDNQGRANLAPYSFFNGVSAMPPMIGFASSGNKAGIDEGKDSLRNIMDTGEFCVNIVSYALRDEMNISSGHYPHGADEFEMAGLTKQTGNIVKAPMVKESPISMECTLFSTTGLPGGTTWVMGNVVGIHIADEHIKDGILDVTSYQPVARLGYKDYSVVTELFSLDRPDQK
ncbi:flavin reductase [Amylibacter ulvae]|uniref:Flavin reductase n=1 Tax=Paramylibacter ulvae TaxID=1651968 RepID=A0ABQ3D0I8_9RHOB|nr:flavin reductase family protein [Amylibacter ulvae]GHA52554.1 flavin reductase [Amylibacter ulvae]